MSVELKHPKPRDTLGKVGREQIQMLRNQKVGRMMFPQLSQPSVCCYECPKTGEEYCVLMGGRRVSGSGSNGPKGTLAMYQTKVSSMFDQQRSVVIWQEVKLDSGKNNEAPENRWGCSLVVVEDCMILSFGWNSTHQFSDSFVFPLPLNPKGAKFYEAKWDRRIRPRSLHCACAVGDRLLSFGGGIAAGAPYTYNNEVLVYDVYSDEWEKPECKGDIPSPRFQSCAMASEDGKQVWIYGGHDGKECLHDLYSLDTGNWTFTKLLDGKTGPVRNFKYPHYQDKLCVRPMRPQMVRSGQRLLIVGGKTGTKQEHVHIQVFDLETGKMSLLRSGFKVLGLVSHSMCCLGNDHLICVGGTASGQRVPNCSILIDLRRTTNMLPSISRPTKKKKSKQDKDRMQDEDGLEDVETFEEEDCLEEDDDKENMPSVVKLVCGKIEKQVSRQALIQHSSYFRAMLTSSMKEAHSHTIQISPHHKVSLSMLQLYLNKKLFKVTNKTVVAHWAAAVHWGIPDLQRRLERIMVYNGLVEQPSQLLEVYLLATQLQCQEFRDALIGLAERQCIWRSPAWKKFKQDHPDEAKGIHE